MQFFYLALTLVLLNGERHVIVGSQFETLRDCNIAIGLMLSDMHMREQVRSWQLDCATRAELQAAMVDKP